MQVDMERFILLVMVKVLEARAVSTLGLDQIKQGVRLQSGNSLTQTSVKSVSNKRVCFK